MPSHSQADRKSRASAPQTYTAEELSSQAKVVVQSEERHSLQPHHDDLERGNRGAEGMELASSPTHS